MEAGTVRSGRSSHSSEDPDIIDLSDRIHSEGTAREGFSLSSTDQGCRSSSSINLLELSEVVEVDTDANQSEAGTICLGNPFQLQFKDDESDVSSVSPAKSEKSGGSQEDPTSAPQVSDITLESGGNVMSPTQSPPLQTMDRVGEYESYDPFRIPSAVFERSRSIAPLEWSIASNESLFSIHVGNTSFSRDHVLMLGGDLGKSGELTKSGPPAIINTRETEMDSFEFEEDPRRVFKDKEGLIAGDLSDGSMPPPAVSWNSSTKSRHSDRSQSSSDSFAFPILADEEAHGESISADAKRKHQNTQGVAVSPISTAKSWFPCCSCSSCYKWSFCSCSSCYKWNSCSCPSCCTWNSCSCHFRHCCHFQRCCHFRLCHFCRR